MIDYYITYENVGSQKSPNLVLSQSFGELLNVISTSPNGSGGIAYADYFTGGDQCFTDMMHNGTGPYADYMASTFMGYNPQRFSGTETLTQVSEIMFA